MIKNTSAAFMLNLEEIMVTVPYSHGLGVALSVVRIRLGNIF